MRPGRVDRRSFRKALVRLQMTLSCRHHLRQTGRAAGSVSCSRIWDT